MDRILMVAPEPFYEDRGTPIALRHVVDALGEIGIGVDVLTFPVGRDLVRPHVRCFRTPNPLGFRSIPIGFSLRKLFLDGFLARQLAQRLRSDRYVAVHAVEEAAYFAVPMARRAGIPVLYDMQSSIPEQLAPHPVLGHPWATRFESAIERAVLRNASFVMCSRGLGDRIRRVAPEVEFEEWNYPSDIRPVEDHEIAALKRELRIAPEMRVVTYSGNFEPYQGLPLVLDAIPLVARDIPDAMFVFVGARDETERRRLERELDPSIRDRVRLLTRQPRERVAAYLALAQVVVSPRVQGGNLPLKIFDYMAAGRPIVATDIPTHRSVLDDNRALLVDPTPEAFGKGMLALLQNPVYAQRLAAAALEASPGERARAEFASDLGRVIERTRGMHRPASARNVDSISVIIPVRNAGSTIGGLVRAVRNQCPSHARCEVIVVDDGSDDDTALEASAAGAQVLERPRAERGNPAAARNLAVEQATGDVLVFLDADCEPQPNWLGALLAAHRRGETVVGGALDLPRDLSFWARVDYYAGWYHVHSARAPGPVPNHPPGNLSVRRALWETGGGFVEEGPAAYAHEELEWQAALGRQGHRIFFEPKAAVDHRNRPGFRNLLARNYRWGYSAVESKAATGAARWSWIYRFPTALVALSVPLALLQTLYIVGAWLRVPDLNAILLAPGILAGRIAYSVGMAVGTTRWIARRGRDEPGERPRWE